jgi:S-adenosylmethionine:tRNA-ribosyltransferase-isomerase (queuine synthetase)
VEYIPGTSFIGFKTYSEIVMKTFDLVKGPTHELTKNARTKQRANFKDPQKYFEIIKEFLFNGDVLILEGQRLISRKLGLSNDKLEESEAFMLERGMANYIMLVQASAKNKIK